jgi:hypothetical protein
MSHSKKFSPTHDEFLYVWVIPPSSLRTFVLSTDPITLKVQVRDRFNGVDAAIFYSNIQITSVILMQAFVPAPGGNGVFPVKSLMPGSVDRPGPGRRDMPGIDLEIMGSSSRSNSHPFVLHVLCFLDLVRNRLYTKQRRCKKQCRCQAQ